MSKAKEFLLQMKNDHNKYREALEEIADGTFGVCAHTNIAREALGMEPWCVNTIDGLPCKHNIRPIYHTTVKRKWFMLDEITETIDYMYCTVCGQPFTKNGSILDV